MRALFLFFILFVVLYSCKPPKEKETQYPRSCYHLLNNENQNRWDLEASLNSEFLKEFDELRNSPKEQDSLGVTKWNTLKNKDVEITFSDSIIERIKIFSNRYSISPFDFELGDSFESLDSIFVLEKVNKRYRINPPKHKNTCKINIYLHFENDSLKSYEAYMQKN